MNSGRLTMGEVKRTLPKEEYPYFNRAERRKLYQIQREFKKTSALGVRDYFMNAPESSQQPREGPSNPLPKGNYATRGWNALKSLLRGRGRNG